MSINTKLAKRLYSVSGNQCAFPDCNKNLTNKNHTSSNMAHIISSKKNGPRYDSSYNNGDYDVEENVILLCAEHHTEIDNNPQLYTREKLISMKKEHEEKIKKLINADSYDKDFIKKIIKLTKKYSVNKYIQDTDFIAPFHSKIIDCLEEFNVALNDLMDNPDTVDLKEKSIVKDCEKIVDNINNIINTVSIKSKYNDNGFLIPQESNNKDRQYIESLRKKIIKVIMHFNSQL